MNTRELHQRDVQADVLVVGGGTAGFGAALCAARAGLKVILIENTSKIGGVMAFCPGMPWGGGFPTGQSIGGVFEELRARLTAMDPPAAERRKCTLDNFGDELVYDHDLATITMFQMLEDAGVDIRTNTVALTPHVEGGRIKDVACCDRLGTYSIAPSFLIDCSGDGDISAKAGVPFRVGDGAGNMMAVTLSFHMIGADWDRVFAETDPYFQKYAARGVAEGRLHPDLAQLYLMKAFHRGAVFCNSVHIRGVDGLDPRAVAAATQEGRERCAQLARFLRQDVPGFEKAYMAHLSPTVGVRETRKLEGMYRLMGADLAKGTKFPDGIVACDNPIDDVMRSDGDMTHDAALKQGDHYTIPFRSMCPDRIENLVFAGRILCADETAFASVRGMPQCMAMGQAAGNAAALALNAQCPIQKIDHQELVARLGDQGVNRLTH